jgi:hypothetical protein
MVKIRLVGVLLTAVTEDDRMVESAASAQIRSPVVDLTVGIEVLPVIGSPLTEIPPFTFSHPVALTIGGATPGVAVESMNMFRSPLEGVIWPVYELAGTFSTSPSVPGPPTTVVIVAVPEQVAVPLPSVAEVGAEVAPVPIEVITKAVPDAIVFEPVRATVAVAVEPLLKFVRVQVWVDEPVIEPPDV